ncbi:MAG: hypothetical protein U0800_23670 [Isosphaeraceae bacterium]
MTIEPAKSGNSHRRKGEMMYKIFQNPLCLLSREELQDFGGIWEERCWLNTPGPFYCAETDTCLGGPLSAPSNVLITEDGQEFIFRQPHNEGELRAVVRAANCEPACGYGADGNLHWTERDIEQWHSRRDEIMEWISRARRNFRTIFKNANFQHNHLDNSLNNFELFIQKQSSNYAQSYSESIQKQHIQH